MIITLEEALASGRGIERPFTCFEAEHSHPTASVNIAKGVWYCLDAATRVLTADLRWVPIGSVVEGQQLAGFDETTVDGRRQWRTATVEACAVVRKPTYEIELDDGTTMIASNDHQWLCYTPGRNDPQWRRTDQLTTRNGNMVSLMRLTDTWQADESWAAGYAAGGWDGEGTYLSRKAYDDHRRSRATRLLFYQSLYSPMLDHFEKALEELQVPYARHAHSNKHGRDMAQVIVSGKANVLRALGTTRPVRMLSKFVVNDLGSLYPIAKPQVVRVTPIGERDVVAVQTSTGTFVAEGLASHNCYSCGAKGAVDDKRVPTVAELEAMLEPEVACREYPASWLITFGVGGYWADRFQMWLCWLYSLGEDPWTGEGTYPVHTPGGRLAGVCRRALSEGPWPKYRYPANWSASRVLFGAASRTDWTPVMVLTEGAADALAVNEVGARGFATYGSHLHQTQVEHVVRMRPSLVLLGQDNDKAGDSGAELAAELLSPHCEVARVNWGAKDPADASPLQRKEALIEAVGASSYRHIDAEIDSWSIRVTQAVEAYEKECA